MYQNYNFPFKPPTPRKKISEVRGSQHWPPESNGHHGLDTFCYVDGKCSECGAASMTSGQATKSIKPILCNGRPRFVQSLSLKCSHCKTKIMAYDKKYIDTLGFEKRRELNAIISGQSYGIDMSLVRALRNGASADEVEQTVRANLYDDWSVCKRQHEEAGGQEQDYPPFPEEYVPKAAQLTKAFLRDMKSESIWLKRELAANKSSSALSIDCQVKVIKKCVKKKDGMSSAQALSILGDNGMVLSHVVVPSDKKEYRSPAMEEVVSRHDNPPKFCYVDRDCCNGKPGGRTDETKMYHGMEKKLDSNHLLMRITDVINSEHKRAAAFVRELSDSIFTSNVRDKFNLGSAIPCLRSLTPKEERCEHVRRHIGSGEKICSNILSRVIYQATKDKDNKTEYERSPAYKSTIPLTTSHWAYPLITTQVWKAIKQQLIHIANGCVSDDGEDMNIIQRQKKYKNTDKTLPVYISTRGTSKNEAFHSLVSAKSREWHQIGPDLYDARLLWIVIHYNRKKLRMAGKKTTLPDGISPSEAGQNEVVLALVEDAENLKFGFEYFEYVKNTKVDIVNGKRNEPSTIIRASSKQNNDYNLLDNIGEVPDELGLEDIGRIGAVLEQALPDISVVGDVSKRDETTIPTDLIEECTESLSQYKQQPPVSQVQYLTIGKEVEDDNFTRSTASTLTSSSSNTDLSGRQKLARETIMKNNMDIDTTRSVEGRRSICNVCFNSRDSTFTFQGRRHIQMNKAEKGAKLKWYCPLSDPKEQYYELLERRDKLKRQCKERENKKRKAKRLKLYLTNNNML